MKQYIIYIIGVALLLAGCRQEQPKVDTAAMQQVDSLNRVIVQKDNEINDMMSTFNDIEEGFRAINAAQQRVSIAREGEGSNATERIRENMQFIQRTMQQNRELINKLRLQLRTSSIKGGQLQRTIENLAQQLEDKSQQIAALQAELQAKDVRIGELSEQVTDLNANVTQLTQQTEQRQQTISAQDKQLNTAWFVFGTKSELKQQNILRDGRVLQGEFNRDYFTKIDIRIDKEIKLYSRSAKMLTPHPASSYTLEPDATKQYVLRINDPQLFWSTSKYLVVLVK
ncbi:MAG: hypothetical protein IJ710_07195 [Prevotella sp.]|nr:hypothetical protein [Prevotella sp.]